MFQSLQREIPFWRATTIADEIICVTKVLDN